MPKVYTGGTFDLFHDGHVELLSWCRYIAGRNNGPNTNQVIVALNTDDFVKRYKGKAPILNYKQRETILKATSFVDKVIPNVDGENSKPTILQAKPDIIVIGMDWLEKDYCAQMNFDAEWLNTHNIALMYVPRTTGESTTNIKSRI